MGCGVTRLRGCGLRVAGLLGYWVSGLLGFWVTGLLGYWGEKARVGPPTRTQKPSNPVTTPRRATQQLLSRARRHPRPPPLPPPPLLEREPRPVLLRHFHPVLADLAGDDGDIAEVEMHVVVGVFADDGAVREDVDIVRQILGQVVVPLDRLLRLQDVRPDAVDVRRRSPHVRRGVEGKLVRRRAVAAVHGGV